MCHLKNMLLQLCLFASNIIRLLVTCLVYFPLQFCEILQFRYSPKKQTPHPSANTFIKTLKVFFPLKIGVFLYN